jgi:hypothetical protein
LQRCRGVAAATAPDSMTSRPCVPVRAYCVPKDLLQDGRSRTHLALAKDAPEPRAVHRFELGEIVAVPEVSGLHHRYDRRAACGQTDGVFGRDTYKSWKRTVGTTKKSMAAMASP